MIGDDCVYSVHWMMGNAVQGCVYSLCGVTVSNRRAISGG